MVHRLSLLSPEPTAVDGLIVLIYLRRALVGRPHLRLSVLLWRLIVIRRLLTVVSLLGRLIPSVTGTLLRVVARYE